MSTGLVTQHPSPSGLEDVPLETFHDFLDTEGLVLLSRTSRALWERTKEPWVWALAAARDFGLERRAALRAGAHPSHLLSALSAPLPCHHALVRRRVAARAASFWARVRTYWAASGLPSLSLLPPPSGVELAAAEAATGLRFPFALRALLGACGGEVQRGAAAHMSGLLGGWHVYDEATSLSLFSGGLPELLRLHLRLCRGDARTAALLPVAFATASAVVYLLDCGEDVGTRGALLCGVVARVMVGGVPSLRVVQLRPAAAGAARATQVGAREGPMEDALLEWCEHFVGLLEGGARAPAPLPEDLQDALAEAAAADPTPQQVAAVPRAPRFLSAWPTRGPGTSHAVTRGVHLFASSLFLPGMSARGQFMFTYRLWLWREAGAAGAPSDITLTHRHWFLRPNEGDEDEVHGEGVVGFFPFLPADGSQHGSREDAFTYASLTHFKGPDGNRMRGALQFEDAAGARVDVELAELEFIGTPAFLYCA